MKRLCVFVFYDPEGIVDDYVIYLLDSIRNIAEDIYVVVNGKLQSESRQRLERITPHILQHENKGYDGGAYKYFFETYGRQINWNHYDELIMSNDSFYGPFGNWEHVFDVMGQQEADFWGLSRAAGYYYEKMQEELGEHIQSYFLVVKKHMFMGDCFWKFWQELKTTLDLEETIKYFETAFTRYFREAGYSGVAYWDVVGGAWLSNRAGVVFMDYPYEMIKDYQFPVIKRKAFSLHNFKRITAMLRLELREKYDVNLIKKHIIRRDALKGDSDFRICDLHQFVGSHNKIYFYGHGKMAENLTAYFNYKGWKIQAYVVSEKNENCGGVIAYDDFIMESDDGLLIALNQKNFAEV